MFSSGFGKRTKHRKFDYLPRYYDPKKEALEETINQYRGDLSESEKVKRRISSGLRQKYIGDDTYRRSTIKKSNLKVLYIVIILSFLTYMIIKSERILKMVEAFTQ